VTTSGGAIPYRFLCDEHVGIPVWRALVAAGHDVVHLLPLGLGGMDDPGVLRYARGQGRILLTRNYRDFAPLVEQWARDHTSFPGVLFLSSALLQADTQAHVAALRVWIAAAMAGTVQVAGTYGWLRQPVDDC
jgi:predicted nuclease of predicted toxin-antitoxin system